MKNQKGFTLVELMVVLAIIAILSTAGISQYGKFIKGARDTTRLADLNALNIVLLDSIQATGTVPDNIDDLKRKIKEVAGKDIRDPLDTRTACLNAQGASTPCAYQYTSCDGGGGYILATSFESMNNVTAKYAKDDVSGDWSEATDAAKTDLYELGTCNAPDAMGLTEISGATVALPTT